MKHVKKQALIITAYQNEEMLENNLKLFSQYFYCYVHIDKKSTLNNPEFLERLNEIENVYAVSKYQINWGSYLHMMAVVDLMKEAYKRSETIRYHIISGEDFPVKTFDEFYKFFEEDNSTKNFIELTDITSIDHFKLRYQKFHFLHIFNRKSKNLGIVVLDKLIRQLQYHLPFKRKIRFDYKGLIWGSITRDAVNVIFDYLTSSMIKSLKYCEIAEEFLLQNALMESKLRDTVVENNLRYANWEGCLTGPKVLTIEMLDEIKKSGAFFARKIQQDKENNSAYDLYLELKSMWEV